MIFKPVTKLTTKADRGFFIEQVKLYISLVENFCKKNKIEKEYNKNIDISEELINIGVIEEKDEINELKKVLKSDYVLFLDSVKFVTENRVEIGPLINKLYNQKRKEIQKNSSENEKYTLVDFFCGAGGLSLGFIQEGFNVKLANDIEDVCIATYRYNHPELPTDKLVQGDIKGIIDNIEQYIDKEIDIVVGGPPCQGFSSANRQRVIDDPRNKLYKYFLEAVEKIGPKFVVMENVKGMLKVAEQVVEDFEMVNVNKKDGENCTYKVNYKVLNSQKFSVAQSRERLIYIAIRSDIQEKQNITAEQIFNEIESNCLNNSIYRLQDALNDIKELQAPRVKNMNEIDSETTGKKVDVNIFEKNANEYLKLINMDRSIPYIYNHKARYCNDNNYEIYRRLEQGNDATDEKIKDIMPYAHRNHCFKDKYYKLIADRPCRTITAHMRMDCHSHIHPYQVRSLTPREAARIQSFPDDYVFLGAYLKTYMQIGNAVPPMMARGIAKVIKKYLDQK